MLRTAGEAGRAPAAPAGVGPEAFWCLRTMRNVGPDGLFVHPSECHDARPCFEDVAAPGGGDEPGDG